MAASNPKVAILAIVPFLMAAAFWWVHPQLAFDADSPRYLAGDPMRTAGYPLFLDLFYGRTLLPLQLGLFAGSLTWLAVYSQRFLPLPTTAAIVLAIGANPYLWELQATVMSEALTTPLLVLLVGCIVGFGMKGRAAPVIAAAFICGLATSIRPPCAPLILIPLCAVFTTQGLQRRAWLLVITIAAWAVPVAAERGYTHAVHGSDVASPLGRHAFMKAAVIEAPATRTNSPDPLDQRLALALNEDFEPIRRTIAKAPSWQVRYILLTNYEACVAWGCGDQILNGVDRPRSDIDRALLDAGMDRLKANPLGYLMLSLTEYQRMWLLHPRKHPDLARAYNAFLAEEGPLPFQGQIGVEAQPTPPEEQSPILRVNRAAFAAVGIVAAFLTIAAAAFRRQSFAGVALPLLLGGQAVLLLCSFTAVGLPRYAMGVWPVIMAGIILAGVSLFELTGNWLKEGKSRDRRTG